MKRIRKILLSTMLLTSVMLMGCNGNSNEVATPTTEKEVVTTTTTKAPVESTNSTTASTENKETTPAKEQETTTTTVTENETTTSATEKETTTVAEQETTTTTPVQEETTITKPVEAETTTQNIQPVVSSDGRTYFNDFSVVPNKYWIAKETNTYTCMYVVPLHEYWDDMAIFNVSDINGRFNNIDDFVKHVETITESESFDVYDYKVGVYECKYIGIVMPMSLKENVDTIYAYVDICAIIKDSKLYTMTYVSDADLGPASAFDVAFTSFRFTGDENIAGSDFKKIESTTGKTPEVSQPTQYVDANGYLLPEYIRYENFGDYVEVYQVLVKDLKEIKIPSTINGAPVESLYGTFADCVSATTIVIPDTVKQINGGAFNNCTSLVNLTLPEGLKSVGANEFKNCTSLKSITFPSTVVNYGSNQFEGCTSLESVTLLNRAGSYAPKEKQPVINHTNFSAAPNKITIYGYHYSLEADYNISHVYGQLAQHHEQLHLYNYVASWMDEGLFQNPMVQ